MLQYLRPEEDGSITVETLAKFSSIFKLVLENSVSYMLQPAEKATRLLHKVNKKRPTQRK